MPLCPALSELYLAGNQIGDTGCVALSNVLPQCPALRYLTLGLNQIGDSVVWGCPMCSPVSSPVFSVCEWNPIGINVKVKLNKMSFTVRNK